MAQAHPATRRRSGNGASPAEQAPPERAVIVTIGTDVQDAASPPRRRNSIGERRHRRPEPISGAVVVEAPPLEDIAEAVVKPRRVRGSRGGKGRRKATVEKVALVEAPPEPEATVVESAKRPRRTAKAAADAKTDAPSRTTRRVGVPEPHDAYDDVAPSPPRITTAAVKARIPVTGEPKDVPAPFAHNAEYEFARILDFYGIAWQYEPRSFTLRWERGHVTEAFTPDFYLQDLDLYVELTTLKSGLTAEKNRKMRQIKELYPDTNIIMLKKRDYLRLLAKYGYGAISPSQIPDIDKVLISTTKLQARVTEMGEQISRDYGGKEPILIGVLRGVLVFMADLMRQISLPTSVDFMSVSSYDGNGSTAVRILKDLELNIKGRDVILVEDIIDTGMTLNHVVDYLHTKKPASIKIATLLDKRARRLIDVPVDYVGFEIPDEFVVGYGLDFHQRFRNLPFIGTLKHELLP